MPPPLRSRSHPAAKRLRQIRDGKDRSLLFVEGLKLGQELLNSSLNIREFFHTSALAQSAPGRALLERLQERRVPGTEMAEDVMGFVSDLETPPGLILLAERPGFDLPALLRRTPAPLLVVLDRLQLPNNVGAVVRVAEAAGAQGVLALEGGADPLGPKALRASAGSAFRLPVSSFPDLTELLKSLRQVGVRAVAADPQGETDYPHWDWRQGTALILGTEGAGLGTATPFSDIPLLRIPMQPPVESLNVSVTAGILLYEAFRQRQKGGGRGP